MDRLHLLCFGRESEVILYFDMYHPGHPTLTPEGLSLDTEPVGHGTTRGIVVGFPEGLSEEG